MEKPTTYIACLLVLVSTGCDKTVLEFPENGGVDPTLVNMNLTLAIDPKIEPYEPTGRSEAPEADTHDVRWIVEVFRDEIGGEPVEQQVLSCEQAADGHHAIRTSLAVHAARYHVVAWMDYVDDGSTADKYYHVNSLSSISVPEAGDYIGNEDHKDAYIAQQEIDLKDYRDRWNATVDATATLQRPMAKIEFITTDIDKFLDELAARRAKAGTIAENLLVKNPDLSTIRVQVEYAGYFPSGFNAYTNKPNDARIRMQHDAADGQGGAPGQRLHLRQWLRIGREGRSYHPRQRGQPAEPYRGHRRANRTGQADDRTRRVSHARLRPRHRHRPRV